MTEGTIHRPANAIGMRQYLAILGAMLLAGCVSSSPEPTEMTRTSLNTAPADLQVSCATAAATQFGVDSSGILPVSSSQIDAQKYQVDLQMRSERATCVVDTEGNVLSVTKA